MSKYYTPELEEFHIGFRYEDYCNESAMWNSAVFKENTFTKKEGRNQDILKDRIHELEQINEIRVKHLDKSDIEELGWKFDSKQSNELLFYKGHKSLTIFDKTYVTIFNEDDSICFDGQIKNYNELFKLMQMLGI